MSMFVFSGRWRERRCALLTGVRTCALPIYRRLEPPDHLVQSGGAEAAGASGEADDVREAHGHLGGLLSGRIQQQPAGGAGQVPAPDVVLQLLDVGHRGGNDGVELFHVEYPARVDQACGELADLPLGQTSEAATPAAGQRSEENTSELQSLRRISYAALCLKKKT